MQKSRFDLFQSSFERSRSDKILGNTGIDRLEHSSTLDTSLRDHKSSGRMYSQVRFVCCSYTVAVAIVLE